jgi:hypothetical protein
MKFKFLLFLWIMQYLAFSQQLKEKEGYMVAEAEQFNYQEKNQLHK